MIDQMTVVEAPVHAALEELLLMIWLSMPRSTDRELDRVLRGWPALAGQVREWLADVSIAAERGGPTLEEMYGVAAQQAALLVQTHPLLSKHDPAWVAEQLGELFRQSNARFMRQVHEALGLATA